MTIADALGTGVSGLARDLLAETRRRLPEGFTCRLLDGDDAPLLRAFRARILERLSDPDHYRTAGEVGDFVADHLGRVGITAAIFANGEMVAYGALGLPGPGDHNRGHDLPLPEAELPMVAHVASAMVDPDCRGRGLHHRLIQWRLDLATALGRVHTLTTVSPRNHASWRHLVAHGLLAKRLLDVGGGLMRLLVHRDAREEPVLDPNTIELCPVTELADRADLFGGGNWVWGCYASGDTPLALFARARAVVPGAAAGGAGGRVRVAVG